MIVSHRHKLIFFAIPNTATHAIRIALRPHLDDSDEEQVGLFVQKKIADPDLAKISHGHISCMQMRDVSDEGLWRSYFKFAFVRNPFDRFVSYCAFMNRNNPDFHDRPQSYMYNTLMSKKNKKHILFQPQHKFICDENENLLTDFVGRYETLENDYHLVCQKSGLQKPRLQKVNGSQHNHFSEYYNEELLDFVKEYYKKDFEIFNYSTELSIPNRA